MTLDKAEALSKESQTDRASETARFADGQRLELGVTGAEMVGVIQMSPIATIEDSSAR